LKREVEKLQGKKRKRIEKEYKKMSNILIEDVKSVGELKSLLAQLKSHEQWIIYDIENNFVMESTKTIFTLIKNWFKK